MREASFILPKPAQIMDNLAIHKMVRDMLLDTFGGYTAEDCTGGWIDQNMIYRDASVRYTVAAGVANSWAKGLAYEKLEFIAHTGAKRAKQVAVYIKDFDGEVHIPRVV